MIGQAVGAATSMLVVNPSAPQPTSRTTTTTTVVQERAAPSAAAAQVDAAWEQVKAKVKSVVGPEPASAAADVLPVGVVEGARKGMDVVKGIAAVAQEKTSDVTRVHALFDEAEQAVYGGDLPTAVRILSPLGGSAAAATRDWIAAAQLRIEADNAVNVVRARTALLTAAMY